MLEEFLTTIDHSRAKRLAFAQFIIAHPHRIPELLDFCARTDAEISYRACWGLEFMCKEHLHYLYPHLDSFITIAPTVYQPPAVRPVAKICEYLTISFYQKKEPDIQHQLTPSHRNALTEICFDWFISDQKVAVKAYTMTSLYWLGTEFSWIHPELKKIMEQEYSTGSAAYKARARQILSKLSRK
ncbi:adenylosuccinate lyase [Aquimarina hainanensis]|uniref:Adenylosuccinate lyase n=1 Tax=Aquimarina hainanensis TaxID=1578017 RepID=A0ABW5NBL2_9FLAO